MSVWRTPALFLLMVAFLTMTVSSASADFALKTCTAQFRSADACYALAGPATASKTVKKAESGIEFLLLTAPGLTGPGNERPSLTIQQASLPATDAALPWRPPRV